MSNADRNAKLGQRDGAGSSTGECAAESLKSLIAHVASQIADADQRHTEMLRQMQARLQSLGIETRSIRDRVPGEYVPAFDRIEEGMQLLADRIAVTHEGRGETHHAAPAPTAAPFAAAERSPMAAVQPAPGARIGGGADYGPSEPWDREQAEALANIYRSGAAGIPLAMADPEADSFPGAGPGADGLAFVPSASHAQDIERGWLEERFAEIAERVEQSLAEMRPDSSFLALGRRFEQFEQRMGSVLEDVATRSDVEGLRLIEAHISELAQHLEQTQIQLERLDGIEHQLNAVVARLGETAHAEPDGRGAVGPAELDEIVSRTADRVASRLAGIAAAPVAAAGSAADYEHLAAIAAEQAISRFAADMRRSEPDGDQSTGELRNLVEEFIRERRQGEEQTAAVLDTMQQAMIRVLDRIDAIELNSHKSPIPASPQEYVREQVRFAVEPREGADLGALRAVADNAKNAADMASQAASFAQPSPAASPFAHTPGADRHMAAPQPAPAFAPAQAPSPAAAASAMPAPELPGRGAKASIDKLRQDFIADAQRAKLRAQAEAAEKTDEAIAAGVAAVKLGKPGKPATAGNATAGSKKPAAAPGGAKPGVAGMPIKKILVAALGLVIVFQGANLLLARRKAEAPPPAATQTKAIAPVATQGAAPGGAVKAPAATAPVQGAPAQGAAIAPAAQPDEGVEASPPAALEAAPPAASQAAPPAVAPAPKPSAAAKSPAASSFVVPTVPHRPNTIPETVVEDLNFESDVPSSRAEQRLTTAEAATTTGSVPLGISLQTSARPPTPYDLARLQQQQQMANLSSKLGVAAAQQSPATQFPEVQPASRTGNVAAALAERAAQQQQMQKSALELPPVTVGPLSLRVAAAKGDPSAEFEVGSRLAEGKGTDQSFKEAVKWYTRSANQGFAQAQYRLGTLFERGLGVKADPARARVWYSRAAEQGNVKAMHNLAVLSAGSKSGSPDYATAAHWFGEAAVRGLGDSQFNLAVLYESGLGVSKDPSLAYQWFALAARSGDKEAVRRRDLAKAALPVVEVTSIDSRVASWLPQSADQLINDAHAAGEAWKTRDNAANEG